MVYGTWAAEKLNDFFLLLLIQVTFYIKGRGESLKPGRNGKIGLMWIAKSKCVVRCHTRQHAKGRHIAGLGLEPNPNLHINFLLTTQPWWMRNPTDPRA